MKCDIGCWGAFDTWGWRSVDGGGGWRWLSRMWHGVQSEMAEGGDRGIRKAPSRCTWLLRTGMWRRWIV
eukprot:3936343-Rhodomonas_salina.1